MATQDIVAPEYLSHHNPRQEVLRVLRLSGEEWNSLEIYVRVHINELFLLVSALKLRPENVLEWGSGFSTFLLCHLGRNWGTRFFLSLDHSREYQQKALRTLSAPLFFEAKCLDLTGGVWPWDEEIHNYATYPLSLGLKFGLIFVDGRRRNECLLVASRILESQGVLIMHDIWRARYQVGMELFREIDRYDQYALLAPR